MASPDTVAAAARSGIRARFSAARWMLAAVAAGLIIAALAGGISVVAAALIAAGVLLALLLPVGEPEIAPPVVASPGMPVGPVPVDARVAAFVAALPEPALLLDARGIVLVANVRAPQAVSSVRIGDPVAFAVRVPEVVEAVRAAAADALPRRVEFADRVPVDRWFEAHVVPILFKPRAEGEPKAPDAVLLTFRDLTQQRRVEQMRADFVANASHELRTPLASLSGFIETLQGPARNDVPARERFLKIMADQARRMSRLIDDLLSLSRIELNAHVRPEAEIDLGAIIGHVCDTLGPLALDRSVALSIIAPAAIIKVRGDRDELIRVFENLVENALKYGGSGGRVDVTLSVEPETAPTMASVAIRDFGPGIAPEHLPRLTERFYRADVASSREQGGTGLGLAIVKHIIARHRGRLSIDSQPGDGATFSVRLNLASVESVPVSEKLKKNQPLELS